MSKPHAVIFSCNFLGNQRFSGSYRVASWLREHSWDVEVVDYIMHWSQDELREFARSRITGHTKFVGFGTLWTAWNDHVESFMSWVKSSWPHIITIMGGQQCQMVNSKVDYFINGYGENAILRLMEHHHGNSRHDLRLDQDWLKFGKRVLNNDDYPSAPMKSLLIRYEDRDYIRPGEWLSIEFSRGCKFACDFCNYPILGVKTDHSRDAVDLRDHMMDAYDRFGVTNYYATDETFNDSVPKMRKFADQIHTLPFKSHFSAFVRADLMVSRPADRELMLEMGFVGQYYGVETMNRSTGKSIGKGMDPDRLMNGILDIKKYFQAAGPYRGDISLIVGLPHEDRQSQQQSIDWLKLNWQGQAIHIWPLGLPSDPMYNKLNAISRDKAKYGYRQSSVPIKADAKYDMISDKLYNWENDHWTYQDAFDYCKSVKKELGKLDFRLSCWVLGEQESADWDNILSIKADQKRHVPVDHISQYKNRKLGMVT